jgi:hypothetical protein
VMGGEMGWGEGMGGRDMRIQPNEFLKKEV